MSVLTLSPPYQTNCLFLNIFYAFKEIIVWFFDSLHFPLTMQLSWFWKSHSLKCWGRILGRNIDKSPKNFPPCYSQSPLLTDLTPLSKSGRFGTGLSCKHCLRKPQVWLSRLCPETSTKLYVMNPASGHHQIRELWSIYMNYNVSNVFDTLWIPGGFDLQNVKLLLTPDISNTSAPDLHVYMFFVWCGMYPLLLPEKECTFLGLKGLNKSQCPRYYFQ